MRIFILASVFVIAVAAATASDLIGVYALVDKVVLEPNDSAPERIQIWGTFMLADGKRGDGLLAPQRGYMYFTLPSTPQATANQQSAAKAEWNDLKKVAGTGKPVGFGSRYSPSESVGRVRKPGEKPQSPDFYTLNVGVVQVPRTDVIEQLRNAK
jgi:hypothetical protein